MRPIESIWKDVSSDAAVWHSMGKWNVMPDLWKAADVSGQDSGVYQGWSQRMIITHTLSKL